MNKYKCNKCGLIVERDCNKQWFYSCCDSTGTLYARFYKQKNVAYLSNVDGKMECTDKPLAAEWLSNNVRERDCMDWSAEIEEITETEDAD